jgi:hypothetical protein
MMKDAKYCLQ